MNSRTVGRDARTHARTQLHVNSAISLDDDAALSIESRGHLPRHESQTDSRTDGRTVVTPDSGRLARPPRDEQCQECTTIRRSCRSPPPAHTTQSTQADHSDSDRRHPLQLLLLHCSCCCCWCCCCGCGCGYSLGCCRCSRRTIIAASRRITE